MISLARHAVLLRMFSSALGSQVVLSAVSFGVSLLLIRYSSDQQYGYYIVAMGIVLLACSLQSSFIAPSMVTRMTKLSHEERGDLIGGLYRGQRRIVAAIAMVALIVALILWSVLAVEFHVLLLVGVTTAVSVAALRRDFFRMVLLAYRRTHVVLVGDIVYALIFMLGAILATIGAVPAVSAVLAAGLAALIASRLMAHSLHRAEAWNALGAPGILAEIAPLGAWSTAGAAIHWSFSQGYTILAAATLDVSTVGAIAATRLLAMPVNLLSTGIGSLMLPLAAQWLNEVGVAALMRRLVWFGLGIAAVSAAYFAVLWGFRDWVFEALLGKQFAQRDLLLLLWSASFVLMAINQQILWLLIVCARFRHLTALTLLSAIIATVCSYWSMLHIGGAGAPLGILIGESVNTIGIVILCMRELTRHGTSHPPSLAIAD
ncbi:MAG: capsular biosynthesis protein [Pseudomonadota bacterium]|nr:capsular biosynthesis protein [Pseudomonadota bacterium]